MPNGNRKTQRDIARMLGISRSYVSRIEKQETQTTNFIQIPNLYFQASNLYVWL
ncbi:helix-turn-helix domain-containing protein [Pelosinus sp. IPA-1]|uniref:helix-turn-helix domain-containing protein n=1 Tax=Pelosinus sp. IPA-1 TaxID=3029569 RepID=UPI0024361FC6|nr:helix-turn-helix domain-containing protein [Pelosinus sp. IPA-1]GMB00880.1 hypothetical protein PIPA1_36790 [Pelosinus sp. IPA-1]